MCLVILDGILHIVMVCYRDSGFFYIPLKSALFFCFFFHFSRQLTWLNSHCKLSLLKWDGSWNFCSNVTSFTGLFGVPLCTCILAVRQRFGRRFCVWFGTVFCGSPRSGILPPLTATVVVLDSYFSALQASALGVPDFSCTTEWSDFALPPDEKPEKNITKKQCCFLFQSIDSYLVSVCFGLFSHACSNHF